MQPQVLYCQNPIVYIAYKPRCIWCRPSHPPGAPACWSAASSSGPGVIALKDVIKEGALPVCAVRSAHSWMLLVASA